jgi:uncharacterized protein (DUF2252 family)
VWTLALDDRQKQLIARLEASREAWQTTAPFVPERTRAAAVARQKKGGALRRLVPHAAHASWKPPKHRPSPVDIVVAGNAGRLEHLVPLRMSRMSASPFAFLRGAAAVMAWDLSHTPVTGIQVLIDGDAHIDNFGFYGSPERDVIVDLNDFDETTAGPWEWDLKRLVASVNVAGRENGMTRKERRRAVMQAVSGYHFNVARLSTMGVLDVWSLYASAEHDQRVVKVPKKAWALIQKVAAKARATTNQTLLPKIAQRHNDGGWRFVEDPPFLTLVDAETRGKIAAALVEYAQNLSPAYRVMLCRYALADVCQRVVGVGSVGTRAYLALLFGNGDHDPLFLQVKEAMPPAHAPYVPAPASRSDDHGFRVVSGQRAIQALGDPLLGHTSIDGRSYYVRQMKNMKASMPVAFMAGPAFEFWAFACGALLARAHARSGDAAGIAGYCGDGHTLDRALADFAEAYGDQTERDHAALVQAIKRGRVESAGRPSPVSP